MQLFPSPCELQLLKPREPQLSWICSVCIVAFDFQAGRGTDEASSKSPFDASVGIKASWLRNYFQQLTQYSGKMSKYFVIAAFRKILLSLESYCGQGLVVSYEQVSCRLRFRKEKLFTGLFIYIYINAAVEACSCHYECQRACETSDDVNSWLPAPDHSKMVAIADHQALTTAR